MSRAVGCGERWGLSSLELTGGMEHVESLRAARYP